MLFGDYPRYRGLPIIPAQSRRGGKNVLDEMARAGVDLDEVAEILENGYTSHRQRKPGTVEKYLDKGKFVSEWGIWESTSYIVTGISAGVGGFFATLYGFRALFVLMLFLSLAGLITSMSLIKRTKS